MGKSYKEAVSALDHTITVLVDCSQDDLNDPTQFNGHTDADAFLRQVHEHFGTGTTILKLYACYYQGWEMDNWAALVSPKDGPIVYVNTTHGVIRTEEV